MGMSISKAQAEALADGFINSLGSGNVDDLDPRETFSELILLAGEFIEDAQQNLNNSNRVASGKLSESLQSTEPIMQDGKMVVDVNMLYYGLFINSGVKGTKSGRSTAGYSFKYDKPSKKHVDAIRTWLQLAHLQTRTIKASNYKGYGKHEKKRISLAKADAAYAVARAIKQLGIVPTGFLDKASGTTAQKVSDRLGAAFKIDIINAIT